MCALMLAALPSRWAAARNGLMLKVEPPCSGPAIRLADSEVPAETAARAARVDAFGS